MHQREWVTQGSNLVCTRRRSYGPLDVPSSTSPGVTGRSRTDTGGITTRCSAVELQPQCPSEVLPLAPPLCWSGALLMS